MCSKTRWTGPRQSCRPLVFNNAGVGAGGLVWASVLCPFFVATDISQSQRNRPGELPASKPTKGQLVGQAMSVKAVSSGKVKVADVAQKVFDAVAANQFYINSHPKAIGSVQIRRHKRNRINQHN